MKKDSFTKGTFYLTISTFIFVASSYITNIWLGRHLGPADYGVYGIIVSLMTLINLMQTTGLPLSVAKFIAEDENESEGILNSGLIIQLISTITASVLLFALSNVIAMLLNDPKLTPYISLTSLIFPFYGIYSIFTNYYNGLHRFKIQAYMGIAYSLSKLICIFVLVYIFNVYGVILGFIISPLVALIFFIHIPKSVKKQYPYKKLIGFSLPLIAIAVFTNLLQSIDLFIVKSLLHSDKLTGIYTANQIIAELPFYGITAVASVLFPSISSSTSNMMHERTRQLIQNSLRFAILILIPCVVLVSNTSGKILTYLYSSSYGGGSESLSILVIGSGFFTLFIIMSTIISSSGNARVATSLSGIGLFFTIVLCFLLIPRLGLTGGALATTIASILIAFAAGIYIYKEFKVLLPIRSAFNILCASFIVMLICNIIIPPTSLLPIYFLGMAIVYVISLWVLNEISTEDIGLIKGLVPRRLLLRFKK